MLTPDDSGSAGACAGMTTVENILGSGRLKRTAKACAYPSRCWAVVHPDRVRAVRQSESVGLVRTQLDEGLDDCDLPPP